MIHDKFFGDVDAFLNFGKIFNVNLHLKNIICFHSFSKASIHFLIQKVTNCLLINILVPTYIPRTYH